MTYMSFSKYPRENNNKEAAFVSITAFTMYTESDWKLRLKTRFLCEDRHSGSLWARSVLNSNTYWSCTITFNSLHEFKIQVESGPMQKRTFYRGTHKQTKTDHQRTQDNTCDVLQYLLKSRNHRGALAVTLRRARNHFLVMRVHATIIAKHNSVSICELHLIDQRCSIRMFLIEPRCSTLGIFSL